MTEATSTTGSNANLVLVNLVKFCLERRTSPVVFQSLLKQIHHKQEITSQDISELLSLRLDFDPLLLVYLSTVTLTEASNAPLKLPSVLSHLKAATLTNQSLLLTTYITQIRSMPKDEKLPLNTFEVQSLIKAVAEYLKYLSQNAPIDLLSRFADFCLNLFDKLPQETNLTQLLMEHQELLAQFIESLQINDNESQTISEELELKLNRLMKKTSISGSLSHQGGTATSSSSSNSSSPHLSFIKSNKSAKLIWLNNCIQTWTTHHLNFLQGFEQFVKIKSNQNVLNDLMSVSFEGYTTALSLHESSITVINWRLFLTKKLPLLIKKLNLKNVETALINALNLVDPKVMQLVKEATITSNTTSSTENKPTANDDSNFDDMFDSFPATVIDIRHDILRSCIALNLIPASSFKTILKQDSNADNRPLPLNEDVIDENGEVVDLQETLKRTLTGINIEFVSLEESELLGFIQLIPKMSPSKQLSISQLIETTIDKFIKEENLLHLYRLSLALTANPEALHVIAFHLSPMKLLSPLCEVIDTWQMNIDDVNFQETYTSFSCVLLLALYIIKQFNVSLEEIVRLKQTQESFVLKYVTRIGKSAKFDNLTDHQLRLFNDWKTALFETGEGISDELIRGSSIQECYEILPVIFQQVFVSYKQNLLDLESVKGGLEYFLQPFLLPTVIGVLAWCENNLWKFQDVDIVTTFLKVLINPSDISGESFFIHKGVLNIYGPNLLKVLKVIDNSIVSPAVGGGGFDIDPTLISSLKSSINSHVSPDNDDHAKVLKFLEFDATNLFTDSSPSLNTLFISEFYSLLDPSTNNSNNFSYDPKLLSTLVKLRGPKGFLNLILSEINKAQLRSSQASDSSSGKLSTLNVIELASFLITITYIRSNSHKSMILRSLKSSPKIERQLADLSQFKDCLGFLKTWNLIHSELSAKGSESIEMEIFKVLGEKLVETIEFYTPPE